MAKRIVETSEAPSAIGAYSQGVIANGFVYTSGQLGLDPATGSLVDNGVGPEAEQALKNLAAILAEAGSGFDDVVRSTIYLADIADFAQVNEIYAAALGGNRPSRVTLQVGALPLGAKVEIEMIATVEESGSF